MPAHSTSWGFGYPFLTVTCIERQDPYDFNDYWGNQPMDPTNPLVYNFLEAFLKEVTALFPDEWLHLVRVKISKITLQGGDEVPYWCWNNTSINEYMKNHGIKTYQQLETEFIIEINKRIKRALDY